jgi:HK97 family phage prohead protease
MPDAFPPTDGMVTEAARGLAWRSEYGRGGTAIGIARARDIVNRKDLPVATWRRIKAYFDRHEVDKRAEGFSPGEDGYPSNGRIAWALWGGDAGYSRAQSIVETANETKASAMEQQNETRDGEGMYPLTPRQQKQYEDLEAVTELFGQFNTGIGEAGAHYVDAAANPFASEGLVCSNCSFYEGPRACEIVAGDIDPSAICKFWIIPESLTSGVTPVDVETVEDMTEEPVTEPEPVRYAAYPVEARRIAGRDVEFRTVEVGTLEAGDEDAEGFARSFTGYAAVFNSPSEPLPFIETIAPGAFKRSLNSGKEIRAYVNHNSDMPLATTKNGSLQLAEDERGLRVNMTLPDTTAGRDLSVLLREGVVHSMSFGFTVPKSGDVWSADGSARTLREIRLHEVSVVSGQPAYAATTGATVRTADDATDTPEPGRSVDIARRYLELARKRK